MTDQEKKRRGGRPRLPESERAKGNVTVRVSKALRDELHAAAARNGRSLMGEIEVRLAESTEKEKAEPSVQAASRLAEFISRQVQAYTRKDWVSDLFTMEALVNTYFLIFRELSEGKEMVIPEHYKKMLKTLRNVEDPADISSFIAYNVMAQVDLAKSIVTVEEKGGPIGGEPPPAYAALKPVLKLMSEATERGEKE